MDDTDPMWSLNERETRVRLESQDTFQIYRKVAGPGKQELLLASSED